MRITEPLRRIPWPPPDSAEPEALVTREWLVTNGLGGYASGTVAGVITRRYHGVLIAALPAPFGRTVMLSQVAQEVRLPDGKHHEFGGRERSGDAPDAHGTGCLVEFRLEAGLPIWRYEVGAVVIEKRVFLPYMQNTVHLMYELVSGAEEVELTVRPSVNFRAQELPVSEPLAWPYEFRAVGDRSEISVAGSPLPPLRLKWRGTDATFTLEAKKIDNVLYPVEESRGYQARGDLWSPGSFRLSLRAGARATLVASTESPETMNVLEPEPALRAERGRRERLVAQAVPEAREGVPAELVIAADQFIIAPAGRTGEIARAHAYGDEVRTVIAGYHWFTDWGRDTMIGLEGLTLVTGRHVEAGYILRTFAHYVRDGLIPNMFPEGERDGLYHTADATLWFFHAVNRYVESSGDRLTLARLYPTLKHIVDCHTQGTRFGIHVDPRDGLIAQGAPGFQLTWMDAKVDDWVVTPRRGKPVEINALWFNALKLMEEWAGDHGDRSAIYRDRAEQVRRSFNERFWFADGRYLYDVIDGEDGGGGSDPKCRPNQILAIALTHPVLIEHRWEPVMRIVRDRLLTPVGLRSLAPGDPEYKSRYFGDLRARDAAYHQGTAWAWLAGPFIDAWLKVYPDDLAGAQRALDGFVPHLNEACIGSISEVFDAEAPFTPRGCIAQAWSVAEVLRVWVKLARRAQQPWQPSSAVMTAS
ncbi:MAG TPA: amylo-alpha-1,6-glucosidase [Vicinamibacterales bacterium]|nr:amylo-alpha-1,6-glucosidase [Vicinamibacterales bacterium]